MPEDAVLSKEQHCSYPFEVDGLSKCVLPMLDLQERRPAKEGGFYPLGLFDNLHGGVHVVAGGKRRPADDVADGGIVHLEEIGGPGLHPAPADEVVECLNAGTIGDLRHGLLLGKEIHYMARAAPSR